MPEPAAIVRQTPLSGEQNEAIQVRGSDVAVTAGAGAGKTRTLVARYLSLLADGLAPRELVAITFTRKAAREMRNRVRQQVRRYLETSDLDAAERAHWQDVYNALDAARIGTIHSLCGEILRHHPAEAGVDPRFRMLDEGQAALLQAQAVDEALAWAADDAAAVRLFSLLGERELRRALSVLLRQRLDVADAFAALPQATQDLTTYWDDRVAASRADALAALLSDPGFAAAVSLLRQVEPLDGEDKLVVQWQQVLDAIGEGGNLVPQALAVLGQVRLNVGSQSAWPGGKEELADIKSALRVLRALWRASAGWLTLELTEVDRLLAEHYPALRALFERACQRYAALKAERPALDFDDLEAGALRLLREHPAVRSYWQATVRASLVDEFQDTNGRQRDLLDLLNGGAGKLFIVGDGKQSIYRFRGADVTVFRQKRQEIADHGRAVDLAISYRAHRALIEGLNALLEPVLGAEEDPARPYIEPFASIAHSREDPASGLRPPFIELHLALGTKQEGALDRAARALVARLVTLVEGQRITVQEADPDSGEVRTRPLHYGDMAILCRASGSFPAYENALEAAGVPFLTVAGRGFYDRPEVRDLLNALQALADPTDDLALAGLLRSPACRLSDMALYRLAEAHRERATLSLWAVLCAGDLAFLEDEAHVARAACDRIRRLYELVGRVPVADVLKAFLDETDYRAALLRAGQARGARNVAKLLSDAHASDIVGVGAFLEYVQQLRDVGTREGEAYTVATGAVQVMSVHAAKGLEFPVVVIGDAGHRSRHATGLLVDPALGVLPLLEDARIAEGDTGQREVQKVDSAIYRLAQRVAQDQEAAESDRLLYVAATRAKEMLLVSGVAGRGLDGWLKRLDVALAIADHLPSEGGDESPEVRSVTLDAAGQPVACTIYPAGAELPVQTAAAIAPSPVALPETLPLLRTFMPEPVAVDEAAREAALDPPRRVWRVVPEKARPAAPAWVVGRIAHGALEQWIFPDDAVRDFVTWAVAEAQNCGITDRAEIQDAVQRAGSVLTRFRATGLSAQMDAAAQRFHEVPYSMIDGEGRLEHGVIDALFRDEMGWTLVEFKTDHVEGPEALEKLLTKEDYVPQVARYLAAVERRLGTRPRPVLCLLNYAGTVRLEENRWVWTSDKPHQSSQQEDMQ